MKKHRKYKKVIMAFVTVLLLTLIVAIGLYKTGIYRFDFLKDIYKKIEFVDCGYIEDTIRFCQVLIAVFWPLDMLKEVKKLTMATMGTDYRSSSLI